MITFEIVAAVLALLTAQLSAHRWLDRGNAHGLGEHVHSHDTHTSETGVDGDEDARPEPVSASCP